MHYASEFFRSELLRLTVSCDGVNGTDIERKTAADKIRLFVKALDESIPNPMVAHVGGFCVGVRGVELGDLGVCVLCLERSRSAWLEIVEAYGLRVVSWNVPDDGHYGDDEKHDPGVDIVRVPGSDARVYWIDRVSRGSEDVSMVRPTGQKGG